MSRNTRLFAVSFSLLLVAALAGLAGLTGCSSSSFGGAGGDSTKGTTPVSLSMTDDPPQGVSVLFFQVQLTDAELTPASGSSSTANVSLLPNGTPVQIDVTKLQALSAFLSTADVAAGQYSSLSLTFANPQLVIYNQSNASLGSSCAVGTVCEITPTIANATVTLNSSPFPVTLSSGSPLGFMVDFHLNTIIQPDLSVDLAATNGVTLATLPPAPKPHYGFLAGAITATSSTGFTLQTPWGRSFTVNTSSSTTFTNFPPAGSTQSLSSVQTGDIVLAQISGIESKGVVDASQVTYETDVNDITVEGTVVKIHPASGSTAASFDLLLKDVTTTDNSISAKLPRGAKATVTVDSSAMFTVDNQGFTLPTDVSFASAADLTVGQDVQVNVSVSSVTSTATAQGFGTHWGPPPPVSFTTTAVQLEPTQISGLVDTVTSTGTSTGFTLDNLPSFFFGWWWWPSPATVKANVETTAATTFTGFSTTDLTGVLSGDKVSVSGWLFATPATTIATSSKTKPAWSNGNSTPPTVVAQTVTFHSNGWF